jgi:hypothetical protein
VTGVGGQFFTLTALDVASARLQLLHAKLDSVFNTCHTCMESASAAAPLYFHDGSSEKTHVTLRDALAVHYSIARPA